MNKDSFFKIGSTHAVCQDYALTGDGYAIVSDGCSGAPDTDLGSRMLSLIAQKNINYDNASDYLNNIKSGLVSLQELLAINPDCLHATLLTISKKNDSFETVVVGDGVVVAQAEDGFMSVYEYEFESGAPYYLRYELDQNLKDYYMSNYSNNVNVTSYHIGPNKSVTNKKVEKFEFNKDNFYFKNNFNFSEWATVGIFSDGLHTFSCNDCPIDSSIVIKTMFDFKSYNGKFVKRRCNKYFTPRQSDNIIHSDDFSFAALSNKE